MAVIFDNKKRNVIPRWRDFNTTTAIGELRSSRSRTNEKTEIAGEDYLISKIKDWEANKTVAFAADVVGAAFVLKRYEEAAGAADFLLNQNTEIPKSLKSVAYKIINPDFEEERIDLYKDEENLNSGQIQIKIHSLRSQLREEPRNAVVYVDLARAYTLLDQNNKATDAMNIALKLSPNNRFILRSASRLFIHANEQEQAHRILRRAETTRFDSWLLSAEIAVATSVGNPSRFAKVGQRVLSDTNYHPSEITELAAAIAMLEIKNGKAREGRRLFRQSLISPNENSIAQIEWASQNLINLDFLNISNYEKVPLIHEAKAWENFSLEKWEGALKECWKWFYDQPFSDRPVNLASYIATTILGNFEESIRILQQGRIANPNDPYLLNNLAFSYASLDKIEDAKKYFNEINLFALEGDVKVVVTATEGLIAFRSNKIDEGRAKYIEAIEFARQIKKENLAKKAFIYLAREEMFANTPEAEKARITALEETKNLEEGGIQMLINRVLKSKRDNSQLKS